MTEYTGQLFGGPDAGNLVTSTVTVIRFQCSYSHWLDGPRKKPSTTIVRGFYVWDETTGTFAWELDNSL